MIKLEEGKYIIGFDNGYQFGKTANFMFDNGVYPLGKQGINLPYSQEQFKGEIIVLDEDELMIRLSLPEPEEPILCSDIYLLFSIEDLSKKRYFTVELLERKWLRKSYCLCERKEDGFHCNYGIIHNNTKKREEKMIHLFYGENE